MKQTLDSISTAELDIAVVGINAKLDTIVSLVKGIGSTTPPVTPPTGSAKTVDVGTGKTFTSMSQAMSTLANGDTILVDGEVKDEASTTAVSATVTVDGKNQGKLNWTKGYNAVMAQSQGLLATQAGVGLTVKNLEMCGAIVPDDNGAAIRANFDGTKLVVDNCFIHDCQNGILGEMPEIQITNSKFDNNGTGNCHGIYVQERNKSVTIDNCVFTKSNFGSLIKSRSDKLTVTKTLAASLEPDKAYCVDMCNGGNNTILKCVLEEKNGNGHVLSFGSEGLKAGVTHQLVVDGCTIINDGPPGYLILLAQGIKQSQIVIKNCIIIGAFYYWFDMLGGTGDTKWKLDPSNKVFADRASAGIAAYPFLPNVPA